MHLPTPIAYLHVNQPHSSRPHSSGHYSVPRRRRAFISEECSRPASVAHVAAGASELGGGFLALFALSLCAEGRARYAGGPRATLLASASAAITSCEAEAAAGSTHARRFSCTGATNRGCDDGTGRPDGVLR